MDPTIILSNGVSTDWTDVDTSSLVDTRTTDLSLYIVEKSGTLGTKVWIRRKGDTSEVEAFRLIDNGSLNVWTSVNDDYIFQYKTDGMIDIYINGFLKNRIKIRME